MAIFQLKLMSVQDFAELYDCKYDLSTNRTVVIDTRPEVEYAICSLPKTTSSSPLYPLRNQLTVLDIPLSTMLSSPDAVPESADIVFICRRGQDSQVAAAALAKAGRRRVKDVIGGLEAWSRDVDPTFPTY